MGNLLNGHAAKRGLLPALLLTAALAGCSGASNSTAGGPDAGLAVATAAMAAGSPRVALQVTQGILERSPDNVPALVVRGDALTQLHQNEDAIAAYQTALRKEPHSVGANLGLARLRLATDPAAAAGMLREALAIEPNNVHALTNLGVALDLLGDHVTAQSDYRKALNNSPNDQAVQVNLALSLAMSGDSAGALRLIEPLARDKAASTKVRHNYAAILAMAGRRADAAKILKDDLSPEDTNRAIAAYAEGTRTATHTPPRDEPPAIVAAAEPPPAPAPIAQAPAASPPPAPVALATPAPAPVAQATPAPAPVAQSTPAPAPVAQSTPAPAPVAQSTPAPAPVAPPPPAAVAQAATPPQARPTETVVVTQTSAPLTSLPAAATVAPAVTPPFAAPTPVPPAPAAVVTTTPPPTNVETEIGPHVQLGAFNSESAAREEWARLQDKLPNLFSGREPAITTVVRDGKTFWRLRTWGFPDQATARGFCSDIRSATPRCMVFGA